MVWLRLEDTFPEHPKVLAAGAIAAWLNVCAIAYCNRQLTDGFVPTAAVAQMGRIRDAATLVRVGLWQQVPGGYEIHDYLRYQPSRAEVEDRRQRDREAKVAGGRARAKRARRIDGRFAPAADQQPASSLAGQSLVPAPAPDQARPVPTRPESFSSRTSLPAPQQEVQVQSSEMAHISRGVRKTMFALERRR